MYPDLTRNNFHASLVQKVKTKNILFYDILCNITRRFAKQSGTVNSTYNKKTKKIKILQHNKLDADSFVLVIV